MTAGVDTVRLTQFAHGGGCACKIPPGELEDDGARAAPAQSPARDLLVGLDDGDDAAAVRVDDGLAVLATADFFTPVVDDAYDWGRIAAANALSDVYAMGGRPVRRRQPARLAARRAAARAGRRGAARRPRRRAPGRLPRGRRAQHRRPGAEVRHGRHRRRRPGPPAAQRRRGGRAAAHPDQAARRRRAQQPAQGDRRGVPRGGRVDGRAQRRDARRAALAPASRAATDVTGFGLLGHLYKMARASGVTAVVDAAAVPYLDGARASLADGFVPGGSRRNLDWVRPHLDATVDLDELLLLADAQTERRAARRRRDARAAPSSASSCPAASTSCGCADRLIRVLTASPARRRDGWRTFPSRRLPEHADSGSRTKLRHPSRFGRSVSGACRRWPWVRRGAGRGARPGRRLLRESGRAIPTRAMMPTTVKPSV